FDVMHSRATDRRSASKCQEKWPDQTRDQDVGLAEVLVAVSSLRLSCKRAGKTRTLSRFGIHLENLGLGDFLSPSPPTEKATARQDQTGQASTGFPRPLRDKD